MDAIESFDDKWKRWDKTYFEAGQKFKACVPFSSYTPMLIHIDHVFPSIYEGRQLIIYRVYGKHKQWWHEFMCHNSEMAQYVDRAKEMKNETRINN